MRHELTRRQREIYDYLREHAGRFAHPPSLEELAGALGMRSRGSLHKHVQALVDAGLVEPLQGRRRGVRLTEAGYGASDGEPTIPLLGRIAAGRPIEAVEDTESVEVPAALLSRRPCYALTVRGDSMIEDGILDGDTVIVERRAHADNGEVVVALVDDEEATLKRIEQRPGRVLLHPANRRLTSLEYAPDRVRIQGVVIGLIRRYR